MSKILTISIAAYNMEKYLAQAVDSLIDERVLNDLEILVVDDGSTDRTGEIAKQYEKRYPDSVSYVPKENGGYGSTINTSITLATGKYFKQLDADDWFETEGLVEFVKLLSRVDADYVVTQYIRCYENTGKTKKNDLYEGLPEGLYTFDEADTKKIVGMHSLAIKTEILKAMPYRLTEKCLYTDEEFVIYPIKYVNSLYIWHQPVYIYRLDREGQSFSLESKMKHYKEHEKVFWNLFEYYKNMDDVSDGKRQFVKRRLKCEYDRQIEWLCLLPPSRQNYRQLQSFRRQVRQGMPELEKETPHRGKVVKLYRYSGGLMYPFIHGLYKIATLMNL